jgi:hypothetical protein
MGCRVDERWRHVGDRKAPDPDGRVLLRRVRINEGSAGDPSTVSVAGSSQGHAVVWRRSAAGWTIQDLGALSGDTYSFAHDVNDEGDVVGSSSTGASGARGSLWTAATGCSRCPAWAVKPIRSRSTTAAMCQHSVQMLPGGVTRSAEWALSGAGRDNFRDTLCVGRPCRVARRRSHRS